MEQVVANIWTARVIPVALAEVVSYADYVVIVLLYGKIQLPYRYSIH